MEKDMQKVVECLRACATGSFKACKACSYRNDCNQLITDALELLEKGCDLSKEVHPMSNNPEENKRIVREGLERRKAERQESRNEARLEQFERDMIRACNENSANAKIEREAVAADRSSKTQSKARIASRKDAKFHKMERETGTVHAVAIYAFAVAFLFWLTTWTHLPIYAAAACAISFFPFLSIYVSKLYAPIEESMEVYTNALIAYGKTTQCIVAVEELSECAKEICKVLRGDGNMDHLAEEIADATICLEQVRLMHGLNDLVRQKMDEKVRRLDGKLRAAAFEDDRAVSGLTSED